MVLENEALLVHDQLEKFDAKLIDKDGSIFVGLGMSTRKELSDGVPFDVLAMLLMAEKIRRKFDLEKVVIQIADTHAKTNKLASDEEVEKRAGMIKKKLETVLKNLSLEKHLVFLSSELNKEKIRKEIWEKIVNNPKITHDYIRDEIIDIEFFRQEFNSQIKLGWMIPGVENGGNDERLFDQIHQEIFGKILNFLHLKPGRSFDKNHWRTSPYIHIAGENRILLEKGEDVTGKISKAREDWKEPTIGGTMGHLNDVIRLFESVCGKVEGKNLEEKISLIISKATDEQ